MSAQVEPELVAQIVEEYVASELSYADQFTNRTPLDESGVWSLHALAADIYAAGFAAGTRTADTRHRGELSRRTAEETR